MRFRSKLLRWRFDVRDEEVVGSDPATLTADQLLDRLLTLRTRCTGNPPQHDVGAVEVDGCSTRR
jgi:hypothetical protein